MLVFFSLMFSVETVLHLEIGITIQIIHDWLNLLLKTVFLICMIEKVKKHPLTELMVFKGFLSDCLKIWVTQNPLLLRTVFLVLGFDCSVGQSMCIQ